MTDFINFIIDMNLCTMDYQFKPLSDENINKIKQSIDEVVQLHNRKQEFEFEVIAIAKDNDILNDEMEVDISRAKLIIYVKLKLK
jgi:hypothetical protein